MAVNADFNTYNDGYTYLDFYPDEQRLRVTDDPQVPDYEHTYLVSFYWDGDKLDSGEREFVGIEIGDIRRLSDEDIRAIECLRLPLVNIPDKDLFGVTVVDVLRRAQRRTLVPSTN